MESIEKLIVTLNVSELRDLIAEAVESKIRELKLVQQASSEKVLPKFMTRQEVAEVFGVSLVSIDKWKKFGLLPQPIKQSGRTYFLRKQIEKLIDDKIALNK